MDSDLDPFEQFVVDAYEDLPAFFKDRLDNVVVVVEDWPDRATLRSVGATSPYGLLGFYHGVPQPLRNGNYGLVSPDKISIYRRPIEAQCRTLEQTRDLVKRVLLHEVAHHFGIDDDRLHEIGAY
jgi:predicted Zn-dependent protease with MMP-like domain